LTRRHLYVAALAGISLGTFLFFSTPARAQKVQERYDDAFKIADDLGSVSITTSSDGKYVFVAGKKGILVSDDHGKTGSWVQTVRMK